MLLAVGCILVLLGVGCILVLLGVGCILVLLGMGCILPLLGEEGILPPLNCWLLSYFTRQEQCNVERDVKKKNPLFSATSCTYCVTVPVFAFPIL